LLQRDQLVMQQVRDSGAALAITMAGGYASPISDTVEIQTNTVAAAYQLFAASM
jgi:hypothetical protein